MTIDNQVDEIKVEHTDPHFDRCGNCQCECELCLTEHGGCICPQCCGAWRSSM